MKFKLLELLIEGIQKDFKDRHGEELFSLFMSVRNKLDKPYNDMSYWMKKSTEELQDFLNNTEIKKSNRETAREEKSGAELVAQDGNIKLYFITSYDAMKYYGKGTKWCIAGNYPGHQGRGQEYFYSYIKDYNLDGGYYVITDGKDKYCILTSDKEIESVWNPADHPVKLNVLPNAFVDVLRKYIEIHMPNEFEIEHGVLLKYNGSDIDVEIPNGVTVIGNSAFYECEEVESIKIPDSVSYIEEKAFFGCSNLFSVVIPKSVVTIGTEAFGRCSSLTNVTILDGIEKIQDGAFFWCSNLNSIIIPASVEYIGQDVFRYCRIETVYYGGTLEKLEKITGRGNYRLFDADNLITEIGDVKLYFNSIIESYNKNGVKMKFRLIERVLNEDIESMKKYFPNIPDEQFQSLIELDPTYKPGSKNAGNYGRWILTLANKGKLDNLGHVKDLLTRFNDESKYLKNKDIMRYKTMDEVEDMLNDEDSYKEQSHRQEVRDRQKARKNADLGSEAEKVYEDSNWEVWVPLTYAASCKLGQGASWCTASTESDYYYNHYKNNYGGEYYINISKQNPEEKYQFHFETNQFMDADDEPIDLGFFLSMGRNRGLKAFYTNLVYDTAIYNWGLEESGETEVDTKILSNWLASGEEVNSTFLQACFNGDAFEYFMDIGNYTTDDGIKNAVMHYTDDSNAKKLRDITGYDISDNDFLEIVLEELPEVYDVLRAATSEGEEVGAESECMNDFSKALKNSMGYLITRFELSYDDTMKVEVNMDYLKDHIFDLLPRDEYDESDFSSALGRYMLKDFYFQEPRYGWSGFDEDAYNQRLSDELSGLE